MAKKQRNKLFTPIGNVVFPVILYSVILVYCYTGILRETHTSQCIYICYFVTSLTIVHILSALHGNKMETKWKQTETKY